MKKFFAMLLALMLLFSASAYAGQAVTANGVVRSGHVVQLIAPFSGVLMPFDWTYGDMVKMGEPLFEMMTQKVYAPADGVMQAVFANEGDLCEDVQMLYGSIGTMSRSNAQIITASTANAYHSDGEPVLHAGETVYLYQTSDKDNKGRGRIIAVNGTNYTVELVSGVFDDGTGVDLFSDENMGTKTKIGSGTVSRHADLPLHGSGRLLKIYVKQGDVIRKGQLLFETVSPDAEPDVTSASVFAPVNGALETGYLVSGQQVYKGQLLCALHDLSKLEVVAQVDEVDLDRIAVGESLDMVFDRYPDKTVTAVVTEIARLGVAKQNAVYYDVVLTFSASDEIVPGMNVTLWLDDGN